MRRSVLDIFVKECEAILSKKEFGEYSVAEFCQTFLKNSLWKDQVDVLEAIERGDRKITWRSGHGVGKTNTAACAVIRYLLKWYGKKKVKVISTAPTARQVEKLLWSEVNSLWPRHEDLRKLAKPLNVSIKLNADCEAYGFTTDEPDKFQGIHAERLLIIIDEANGFPDELFDALESCLTGENNQLLAIGNPITPYGRFYELDNDPSVTHFCTPSTNHPNIIEGREVIAGAVTQSWIDDYVRKNQAFPDLIKGRVHAQWPSINATLGFSTEIFDKAYSVPIATDTPTVISCDVARYGPDKTVFTRFDGQAVRYQLTFGKMGVDEVGRKLISLGNQCENRVWEIVVDDDGVGGGVTDIVRANSTLNVIPFRNGSKAIEEERFGNLVTEAYWHTREAFDNELLSFSGFETEFGDELRFELTNRQYRFNPKGHVYLESKDQFKKRTGKGSPDHSDSFCMGAYRLLSAWKQMVGQYG